MEKIPVVAVIGPTASGKTEYALSLAEKLNGEIVSGDSMQVYRGMDIGTAKPTREEMRGIRHHLIDIADISEAFSLSRFVAEAKKAVADIYSRGKTPIIAGGTGLYIDTLINGISLSESEESAETRERLYSFAQENGAGALHGRLREIDPAAADAIEPNNIRRVVRAIEIYETTGITKTELDRRSRAGESEYAAKTVMLMPRDRSSMYARIDARADSMLARGLGDEVSALVKNGLRETKTASQAIGYREFFPYFDGECTLGDVRDRICLDTRRFAKRQLTWFSRMKKDEIIEV